MGPRHPRPNALIAFYGGTELSQELARFVEILAEAVMEGDRVALVTGGFWRKSSNPTAVSVDLSVVVGAKRYLARRALPVEEFIQTWLPDSDMDRRRDGVERFREGNVRSLAGRSAQARRFTLVQEVDALVTFKGKRNTAMVLDLALAIGRPALPLPFTGGDSEDYWKANRAQVQKWFDIDDAFAEELENIDLATLAEADQWSLAHRLRDALRAGLVRRCLILMPYDPGPEQTYAQILEPTLESEGFIPVRIDRTPEGGPIYDSFLKNLQACECVVADITDMNPNVMYELGHTHARGIHPFLFRRNDPVDGPEAALPFYLQSHKVTRQGSPSGADVLVTNLRAFLRALERSS